MTDHIGMEFKQAMRRLAASVTLVTLTDDGVFKGMAATAVCSLSAEPPSLLVCINRAASLHSHLTSASHFAVNILHTDQIEIAKRFSDNSLRDVRFENADWVRHEMGPPILRDAQVSLVCTRSELISFGTHTICIGTVVDIQNRVDIDPLIYANGAFSAIS
ncbi:MAG: flavin reductase family protein [Sphingobium sp.]